MVVHTVRVVRSGVRIHHNLGTRDVTVQTFAVTSIGTDWEPVFIGYSITDENIIQLHAAEGYRLQVIITDGISTYNWIGGGG